MTPDAAEPVMIYHGECTIDCGNHGHHNVELLKLIAAGTKLYAGPRQPEPVQAEPVISKDAYDGAREDMGIWKTRALKAEELNRKFVASVNSQTFMGEPVDKLTITAPEVDKEQAEPVTEEMVDAARAHYIALERSGAIGLSVAAVQEMIEAHKQSEPAQPEPVAWLRAIDEAMVVHHCGVADPADDYETAKRKLNILLCLAQTEPVVLTDEVIREAVHAFSAWDFSLSPDGPPMAERMRAAVEAAILEQARERGRQIARSLRLE